MEVEKRFLRDMKVVDLKMELEKRGLDKHGVKAVLIDRLTKAIEAEGLSADTHLFDLTEGKVANKDDSINTEKSDDLDGSTNGVTEGNGEETQQTDKPANTVVPPPTPFADRTLQVDAETGGQVKTENEEAEVTAGTDTSQGDAGTEEVDEDAGNDGAQQDGGTEENQDIDDDALISLNEETLLMENDDEEELAPKAEADPEEQDGADAVQEDLLSVHVDQEVGELTLHAGADLIKDVEGLDGDSENIKKESEEDGGEKLDVSAPTEGTGKEDGSQEPAEEGAAVEGESTNAEPVDGTSDAAKEQSASDGDKKKDGKPGVGANLWVSNLSPDTKATDLKRLFSRHGKLMGAKIVTSARTPGARCYGYVTMANTDDADRCIRFLHRVELHSRLISVERAKDDATGPLRIRRSSGEVHAPANKTTGPDKGGVQKSPSKSRSQTAGRPRRRSTSPDVLSFAKIKEERDRQRHREEERRLREVNKVRRDQEEEMRIRERERRQRIEADRLEKEKNRLRQEREKLEREKEQLLRLERDRQRLERERIEREKEEVRNRKKRLEERPVVPRVPTKRPADDKRTDYASKRTAVDKDMLLEPPPPPRFNDSDRRDRARRDEKRPETRRDDYRHTSPAREGYARSSSRYKVERRSGKEETRAPRSYDSKTKHTSSQSHGESKSWSSNGAPYKPYSAGSSSYNREVWSDTRQQWSQPESTSRWPAETDAVPARSYPSAVYGGTPYSAQPSPPGVATTHARYADPRFDAYAHSLPVRKY